MNIIEEILKGWKYILGMGILLGTLIAILPIMFKGLSLYFDWINNLFDKD